MTPQERQILTAYLDRIRQTQPGQKDMEADQLIQQMAVQQPDAAYILTQTALIQDYSLRQARAQIEQLQTQLREAEAARQQKSGGFFSSIFGGGTPTPQPSATPGPWSQPANPGYGARPAQGYAPPPPPPNYQQAGYAQGSYAQPGYSGGGFAQPAQPSFFRGAAETAVGIAGGALLFEGVESLFSGHHGFGGYGGMGGAWGGSPWDGGPSEVVNETVVNNYYDDSSNQGIPTDQQADYGSFSDANYTPDNTDYGNDPGSFDDGSSWDSGSGGGDDSDYI